MKLINTPSRNPYRDLTFNEFNKMLKEVQLAFKRHGVRCKHCQNEFLLDLLTAGGSGQCTAINNGRKPRERG
jgi:hypothetical protein